MNKYCRLCWNTANWTRPTGEAAALEIQSYVSKNGFGHEEWLFDMAWPLRGYKGSENSYCYGFLQPIGKYRTKYVGQEMDVCLYTISPEKVRLFVGIIRNVYVPDDAELVWALAQSIKLGRLKKMNADLARIGKGPLVAPSTDRCGDILNVRFKSANVEIFDPRPIAPKLHIVSTRARYHPFNWLDSAPSVPDGVEGLALPGSADHDDPSRSEAMRIRSAISGTQYSPEHVKLQNALCKWLKAEHKEATVEYEKDYVDLTLHEADRTTFFEVKTAITAKGCIREAMGQLLEYGHYADKTKANRLVVVGAANATPQDAKYLAHLRKLYRMPIGYRSWRWDSLSLGPEI